MSSKALDIKNPYKDLLDNSHISCSAPGMLKGQRFVGTQWGVQGGGQLGGPGAALHRKKGREGGPSRGSIR